MSLIEWDALAALFARWHCRDPLRPPSFSHARRHSAEGWPQIVHELRGKMLRLLAGCTPAALGGLGAIRGLGFLGLSGGPTSGVPGGTDGQRLEETIFG